MFKKLVASEGKKGGIFTPGAGLASLLIHGGMIAAFVAVGVGAEAAAKKAEELVDYVEIEEEKAPEPEQPKVEEPPPPPPPTPEPMQEAPPVVKGTQELIPPETPPTEIKAPDPNQVAVSPADFSGQGQLGGVANGVESGGVAQDVSTRTAPPDQGTYDLESVQEKPSLSNGAEVQRTLSRSYPPLLRDAGVAGTVTVKMRVNEDGRVDAESVEILETSHEAFGDAAKRVVERMRFRPAKVDGRPVKVWVILPVTFQVPR